MRGPAVVGVVALAFVGGLVLGGVGPREEVRRLEGELFEAQQRGAGLAGVDIARVVTEGLPRGQGAGRSGAGAPGATTFDEAGADDIGGEDPFEARADRRGAMQMQGTSSMIRVSARIPVRSMAGSGVEGHGGLPGLGKSR